MGTERYNNGKTKSTFSSFLLYVGMCENLVKTQQKTVC